VLTAIIPSSTMQTGLPDLPFPNYADAVLEPGGFHSAVRASRRTHPRTDLAVLTHWDSFVDDIHQAIQSTTSRANLPHTPFSIEAWNNIEYVENEASIRAHARSALHKPVEEVAHKLGISGRFRIPCGNTAIIGDPDFSWIMNAAQPHPKLIVRLSTTRIYRY
jgi:hypothetical protein